MDELCILGIRTTTSGKSPDSEYPNDIDSKTFKPLCYGGGISKNFEIEKLFYIGIESYYQYRLN